MVTVDTHVIIWEALTPEKLTKRARLTFDKANESGSSFNCGHFYLFTFRFNSSRSKLTRIQTH